MATSYNFAKKALDIKQRITFSDKFNWPELNWIETDKLFHQSISCDLPSPVPESIAFLQYTSGSTSDPKVPLSFNIDHCEL